MKTCTGYATLALVGWALAVAMFAAWNNARDRSRAMSNDIDAIRYQATVDSMVMAAKLIDAEQKIAALDAYLSGRPKPQQRIHEYRTHLFGSTPDSLGAILDKLPE